MGRRSDHSREDLQALCLAAARRIMAEQGLSGLTARRLGKAIGYSPGTLYNLFENLDDLALQVNAETLDRLHERLAEALAGPLDIEDALRAMARTYIDCARAEPQLWAALFEHRRPPGHPLPDWYLGRVARLFELLERTLDPIFEPAAGEARRRTARVLWSALHGIASLALAQRLELLAQLTAEEMADELVTTYLAGLLARRGG